MKNIIDVTNTKLGIDQILDLNKNNLLNLKPEYQRESVWPIAAKQYLINSIFEGYPIPPISASEEFDSNQNRMKTIIIDGQQRLTAIIEYLDNKFSFSIDNIKGLNNKKYNELPDEYKEVFMKFKIDFRYFKEENQERVHQIYSRLNTYNFVLNPEELRQAKYFGYFRNKIDFLYSKYKESFLNFKNLKLNTYSEEQVQRLVPKKNYSRMCIFYFNSIKNDNFISDSADDIEKIYKELDYKDNNLKKEDKIFEEIQKIYDFIINLQKEISESNENNKLFQGKIWNNKNIVTLFQFFSYLNIKEKINLINNKNKLKDFIIYLDYIICYFSVQKDDKKEKYLSKIKEINKNWKENDYNDNFYFRINNATTNHTNIKIKLIFMIKEFFIFQ